MSVFKPLSSKDRIVTPFTVHKHFTFTADEFIDSGSVGIDRFEGKYEGGLFTSGSDPTGYIKTESKRLIYSSIKQLYYSNYDKGPLASGSFKNSLAGIFDDRRTFPLAAPDISLDFDINGGAYPYYFPSSTPPGSNGIATFLDVNGDFNLVETATVSFSRFDQNGNDLFDVLNASLYGGKLIFTIKVSDEYSYSISSGTYDVSTEVFTFNVQFTEYRQFNFGTGQWITPPIEEVNPFLATTPAIAGFEPDPSEGRIGVLSIPSKLFGEYIRPNSFKLILGDNTLADDGEGNIKIGGFIVGNIIYSQGIITITIDDPTGEAQNPGYGESQYGLNVYGEFGDGFIDTLVNTNNVTCSFDSSRAIYESQYKCTFLESDYNYSYNPSLSAPGSDKEKGSLIYNDYVTSSFFSPYVTTVGLYNNNQELLAVGKLSQPLPTSQTTDTTILINLDL